MSLHSFLSSLGIQMPLSGSMSSNESVHHEVASLHASTVGTAGSKKSSKSLAILSQAMRHATDGFIGILDMFGFEDSKPSQLEQLCINLCSETMQHFYNTHTLKTAIETCRDEGISCGVEVDYADNAHCIDLISSLVSITFIRKERKGKEIIIISNIYLILSGPGC